MSARPKKYTGKLTKPIDLRRRELLLRPEFPNIDAAVEAEIIEKTRLLLVHYGIELALPPEQMWQRLALNLAFAHVPGFHITASSRKGAKRKWTLDECRALVCAVDAQKTNKGLKVAIRMAMKRKGWKWGTNLASMEVRYHEAVRQIKADEFARNHPYSFEGLMSSGDMYTPRRKRTRTTKPD